MQNLLTKSIIKKAVDSNPGGGAFCVTDETQLKKLSTPEWACYIGVDTYDKDNLAYCLVRRVDGVSEILLSRVMHSEYALNQEVDNLMQYFNAIKIEEKF